MTEWIDKVVPVSPLVVRSLSVSSDRVDVTAFGSAVSSTIAGPATARLNVEVIVRFQKPDVLELNLGAVLGTVVRGLVPPRGATFVIESYTLTPIDKANARSVLELTFPVPTDGLNPVATNFIAMGQSYWDGVEVAFVPRTPRPVAPIMMTTGDVQEVALGRRGDRVLRFSWEEWGIQTTPNTQPDTPPDPTPRRLIDL